MAIQNPFGSIANPQNPMGIKTVAKPQGLGLIQSLAQKQQPQQQQQTQPIGVKASSPMLNIKPAPQTLPQTFQQKQATPVVAASTQDGQTAQNIDTNYQMKPGETNDQYNARIKAYNASKQPATSAPIQETQGTSVQPTGFTPNTGLYGQLLTTLANRSMQPSDQYTQAIQKAQDINAQIEASKAGAAQQIAGIEATPIPLEFQQGRGQIVTQQALAQQGALASQLAGQTALAGQGIQQQQLQQQGLGTALGAAAPTQVPYGTQFISPVTGTSQLPGGGGDFQQAMSTYAQMAANNQMAGIPSSITGNPVLMAQLLQQAKQINPSFNVNVAQGAGSAQAGAAQTQASTIQQYQSALQQGQNLQSQLTDLITTFGLNPQDINKVNQGIQAIANNVSDPRYKVLQNYVNDIANTYAQILTPAGGSQTDTTRGIASGMLDATMKGTSIIDVMKTLDNQAQAKIAGTATAGGLGGGGSTSGTLPSGAGYKLVNGVYVKA